jgi:hypothetical protein
MRVGEGRLPQDVHTKPEVRSIDFLSQNICLSFFGILYVSAYGDENLGASKAADSSRSLCMTIYYDKH